MYLKILDLTVGVLLLTVLFSVSVSSNDYGSGMLAQVDSGGNSATQVTTSGTSVISNTTTTTSGSVPSSVSGMTNATGVTSTTGTSSTTVGTGATASSPNTGTTNAVLPSTTSLLPNSNSSTEAIMTASGNTTVKKTEDKELLRTTAESDEKIKHEEVTKNSGPNVIKNVSTTTGPARHSLPVTAVLNIQNGRISGNTSLSIDASNATAVEIYLSRGSAASSIYLGSATKTDGYERKWSYSWDSTQTPNGDYKIWVLAKNEDNSALSPRMMAVVGNKNAPVVPEVFTRVNGVTTISKNIDNGKVATTGAESASNNVTGSNSQVDNQTTGSVENNSNAPKVNPEIKITAKEDKIKNDILNYVLVYSSDIKQKVTERVTNPPVAETTGGVAPTTTTSAIETTKKQEEQDKTNKIEDNRIVNKISEKEAIAKKELEKKITNAITAPPAVTSDQTTASPVVGKISDSVVRASNEYFGKIDTVVKTEMGFVPAAAKETKVEIQNQVKEKAVELDTVAEEKVKAAIALEDPRVSGYVEKETFKIFEVKLVSVVSRDKPRRTESVGVSPAINGGNGSPSLSTPTTPVVPITPSSPTTASSVPPTGLGVNNLIEATTSVPTTVVDEGPKQLVLAGKAMPDTFVTIYIYSSPIIVTVKTDSDGNWSYTLDKELPDGEHEAYVALTDRAGRVVSKSESFSFVKEAQAVTITKPAIIPESAPPPGFFSSSNINLIGLIVSVFALLIVIVLSFRKKEVVTVSTSNTPNTPPDSQNTPRT